MDSIHELKQPLKPQKAHVNLVVELITDFHSKEAREKAVYVAWSLIWANDGIAHPMSPG
jgi:hypothetical protein